MQCRDQNQENEGKPILSTGEEHMWHLLKEKDKAVTVYCKKESIPSALVHQHSIYIAASMHVEPLQQNQTHKSQNL